jgi:hypothetical protein
MMALRLIELRRVGRAHRVLDWGIQSVVPNRITSFHQIGLPIGVKCTPYWTVNGRSELATGNGFSSAIGRARGANG